MEKELLQIENLYMEYRSGGGVSRTVNGLNLTIHKGEVLGLVGENGAGKTMTVLSAMGLLPDKVGYIAQGDIRYCGESLLNKKSRELDQIRGNRISMIFASPLTSLDPVFTVGHQIAMGLRKHKKLSKKEAQQEAARLLEVVGTASYRPDDYPHQSSGGMRQRVRVAATLAYSPEFLLADEPTTALDITIRAQILELMEKLQKEYSTSLAVITRNPGIIMELCQKVVIMYGGEIVEYGNVQEVFENPKHWYTYGLLHAIPKLTEERQPLKSTPDLVANSQNLPEGCKFRNRYVHHAGQCERESPSLVKINEHHYAACWEVPKSLRRSWKMKLGRL